MMTTFPGYRFGFMLPFVVVVSILSIFHPGGNTSVSDDKVTPPGFAANVPGIRVHLNECRISNQKDVQFFVESILCPGLTKGNLTCLTCKLDSYSGLKHAKCFPCATTPTPKQLFVFKILVGVWKFLSLVTVGLVALCIYQIGFWRGHRDGVRWQLSELLHGQIEEAAVIVYHLIHERRRLNGRRNIWPERNRG